MIVSVFCAVSSNCNKNCLAELCDKFYENKFRTVNECLTL